MTGDAPPISLWANIGAMVGVLCLGVIGVSLSFFMRKSSRLFSIGIAFAGGVMLAAALVHVIPEAEENYSHYLKKEPSEPKTANSEDSEDAPHKAECTTFNCPKPSCNPPRSSGRALRFPGEGWAFISAPTALPSVLCQSCQHENPSANVNCESCGYSLPTAVDQATIIDTPIDQPIEEPIASPNEEPIASPNMEQNDIPDEPIDTPGEGHSGSSGDSDKKKEKPHPFPLVGCIAGASFLLLVLVEQSIKSFLSKRAKPSECCDSHHHHPPKLEDTCHSNNETKCCDDVEPLNSLSHVSAVAVFFAMCLHSVMEGVSLGKASQPSQLVSACIGIGTHKVFEAFAVGAALIDARVSLTRFYLLACVFCLASPIGAVVGLISKSFEAQFGGDLGSAIINAITAGTFLQVATMELMPKAFEKQGVVGLKLVSVITGFSLICLIAFFFPHDCSQTGTNKICC